MKILLTECYSATNIGDLELVSRSLQVASATYPNGKIECIASDPDSFRGIINSLSFKRPIFDRLKMIKGSPVVKVLGMVHAITTVGFFTLAALLPRTLARGLVALFIKFGLGNSTAAEYLSAQRIVAVGGGYLGDKYGKMTILTVWTWWWANRMGCLVETMPMSVEVSTPILTTFLRIFGKKIVWRVRDQASVKVLKACHIQCELVPDLAFLNAEIMQSAPSSRSGLLVALVGDDYLSETEQSTLFNQLAENIFTHFPQSEVTLLSMHRSMSGTHVGGDVVASQKMSALLESKGIRNSLVNAATYDEVCQHCLNVEYVISARMHAGIAALCSGAKVGLLAYEEKHLALMKDLGLDNFAIDIRCDDLMMRNLFELLIHTQPLLLQERTMQHYSSLKKWIDGNAVT